MFYRFTVLIWTPNLYLEVQDVGHCSDFARTSPQHRFHILGVSKFICLWHYYWFVIYLAFSTFIFSANHYVDKKKNTNKTYVCLILFCCYCPFVIHIFTFPSKWKRMRASGISFQKCPHDKDNTYWVIWSFVFLFRFIAFRIRLN